MKHPTADVDFRPHKDYSREEPPAADNVSGPDDTREMKRKGKVEGIGPLSTAAGCSQWRRNSQFSVANASDDPNAALTWLLLAENCKGPLEEIPFDGDWKTEYQNK